MSELFDVIDKNGDVIGQATREECHRNPGLIHRVVHCWLFNEKGQVLWQQRSMKKDAAPGEWDMSCGGHVAAGEEPEETLKRELKEELGLENIDTKLVEKYLKTDDANTQTELIFLYYAVVDRKESEFTINKEETQSLMWIDVDEAQMKYAKGKVKSTEFIISQVSKILQSLFKRNLS